MKDGFGRPLTSLRVSITSRCNLRCFYCHHEGHVSGEELTPEELGKAVELAMELGVRKVKLTGGEPLLREDVVEVVRAVAKPSIQEVSLATNGTLLEGLAEELKQAGLSRVNVGLDTLDPKTFKRITGKPWLRRVLAGVEAALEAGLKPVKINMVVLAGVNEEEVERMYEFASKRGAVLQLIELVDAGWKCFPRYHLDLGEVERRFAQRALRVETRWQMHARRKYLLPEGRVEFVRPMHNSEFCSHCTRLRLTADGKLKPCLLRDDNLVDLLTPLRAGNEEGARRAFKLAVERREPYFRG